MASIVVPPFVVGQFGLLIICSSKWSNRNSNKGRADGKLKLTLKSPAKTIILLVGVLEYKICEGAREPMVLNLNK